MRVRKVIADVAQAACDLLLANRCAGCAASAGLSRGLCAACRLAIAPSPRVVATAVPVGVPVIAATDYDGAPRGALLAYKEHGRTCLRTDLAGALTAAVRSALGPGPAVLLVPVPSSRASRRARGHDPVSGLARTSAAELAALGHRARAVALLRQRRRPADQSGLGAAARRANLANALAADPRAAALASRYRVVVVDDIVTTGATAAEAVRALRAVGAGVQVVVAVAATPRRAAARTGRIPVGPSPPVHAAAPRCVPR